jgi:hypothetical protein
MKLDTDPFPINVVKLGERKILVHTSQASTTRGKNVIVSDELRNQMVKPRSREVGVWKENFVRRPVQRVKPMSIMLIDKYKRQQQWRAVGQLSGSKRHRSLGYQHYHGGQDNHHAWVLSRMSWASIRKRGRDLQGNQRQLVERAKFPANRSVRKETHLKVQRLARDTITIGTIPSSIVSVVHVDGCCVA